ncbi:MAG: hypothetical protein ACLPY5_04640 [Candidatus Bathyarchaeia archaeon]
MAVEKKKVRIESVPNDLSKEAQGIKVAPPVDPITQVPIDPNTQVPAVPIKQVEPILRVKDREFKQAPPPDPPEQQSSSESED